MDHSPYIIGSTDQTVPGQVPRICVTSKPANISWDPLPCRLQKGVNITGYIIQYSHIPTENSYNITVSAQLSCILDPVSVCSYPINSTFTNERNVIIQVAAMNSRGQVGPFSDSLNATLNSEGYQMY